MQAKLDKAGGASVELRPSSKSAVKMDSGITVGWCHIQVDLGQK